MPDPPSKDYEKGDVNANASAIEDATNGIERIATRKPWDGEALKGSWTVMVFMVVDDVLRPFADRDFQEMASIGSNGGLQVLAGAHWGRGWPPEKPIVVRKNDELKRPNTSPPRGIDESPVLHGESVNQTFTEFLTWAAGKSSTFANEHDGDHHTMLLLWGHAYGMRFGGLDSEGMKIQEISTALETARTKHSLELDILGFDACATSRVEVVKALGPVAKHIIGSQIGVPYSGWPYERVLQEIQQNPGIAPENLGQAILGHYYDSYRPPRVSATMLNGKANYGDIEVEFDKLVDGLSALLSNAGVLSNDVAEKVFAAFAASRHDAASPVIDLLDFCENLVASFDQMQDSNFKSLWNALSPTAIELITLLRGGSVIEGHEERGPDVAHLNGLGVSPYDVTRDQAWDQHLEKYTKLRLSRPRRWQPT